MTEVIFPTGIPNGTPASDDRVLFSDTSDGETTKDCAFSDLPIPTLVQTQLDNKVDKVAGKGLSTNDYDNTEKANVAANTSARHTHSNKTILDQIANNPVETIVAGANITVSRTGNSVTINSTGGGGGGGGGGDMYKAVYDPQNIEADAFDRANHTGTQTMSTISDAGALATLDQVDTAQIVNHAVENTKLAQMNANTVKGRLSGNGTPQDVAMSDLPISTATQTALDGKVGTTGNETIAGIKTFTSPVLSNDVRLTNGTATQGETHADLTVIVRTATTANITLSGTQTIDGQTLVANDLVLVKNQSTASQNGVYVVNAGAWTRATNYNITDHFNRRYVYAISGTTNTATLWICNTRNPTVGTTSTTFAQIPLGIGTGATNAAAGNHTHTSIATTAASSIGSAVAYRFTSRTATATTGANDLVVEFTGSTASQIETMPDGVALSNNSGRILVYRNSATVPWTIRQSASNTLDGSSADYTLAVGETLTVLNKADNVWISLNKPVGGGSTSKTFDITIPGEQIADTSNFQGFYFYNNTGATITISNVAFAVGTAAAGSGAACAFNIYKSSGTASDGLNTNAVNLFTTAVDLGTGYTSLTNVPNTTTVENGRWVTARVTSSAGATNKASNAKIIVTYS